MHAHVVNGKFHQSSQAEHNKTQGSPAPSPLAPPLSVELPPRRLSHCLGRSLWDRRRRQIGRIELQADAADRWFLLLTTLAQEFGDREIDAALDGAIDADPRAIVLFEAAR